MSAVAWIVNPRKRRRKAKARHRHAGRSAAQRAATARMLAANRSKRRGARRSYAVNPAPSKRRSSRSIRRGARKAYRRISAGAPGMVSMLKNAGIAGGGAVVVDIGMGYLGGMLPAAAAPVNADGSTNWLYFAAKTGLAVGLGTFGRRVLPGGVAQKMGEGALTVLAYQIIRGLVPSGVSLGGVGRTGAYFSPAATMRPRLAGSGRDGASFAGSGRGSASFGGVGIYAGDNEGSAQSAANIVAMARRRG